MLFLKLILKALMLLLKLILKALMLLLKPILIVQKPKIKLNQLILTQFMIMT